MEKLILTFIIKLIFQLKICNLSYSNFKKEIIDKKYKGVMFKKSYPFSVFCVKESTNKSFSIKTIREIDIKTLIQKLFNSVFRISNH